MKRIASKSNKTAKLTISTTVSQDTSTTEPFVIPQIELSYKTRVKAAERPIIGNSDAAYRYLHQSWDKGKIEMQEQFKVLLLNRSNRALGLYELSEGGVTSTIVDSKLIFAAAVKANASVIILAHNHPSGDLRASSADKLLTRKIEQAGKLLDIDVIDHLIVTNTGYFSFASEGLL